MDSLAEDEAEPEAEKRVEQLIATLPRVARVSIGDRHGPFEQAEVPERVQVIPQRCALHPHRLADLLLTHTAGGNRLQDRKIDTWLAQLHLQKKARLVVQKRALAQDFALDVVKQRPPIGKLAQVSGHATQHGVSPHLILWAVTGKEKPGIGEAQGAQMPLCGAPAIEGGLVSEHLALHDANVAAAQDKH